jgi:hypothetical protein
VKRERFAARALEAIGSWAEDKVLPATAPA